MTKEERRRVVLEFLADYGLALPPKAIYRNLRLHRNITFTSKTLDSYLEEFVEEGLVRRIDPKKLSDRDVEDIPSDDGRRGYYIITEEGRDYLQ